MRSHSLVIQFVVVLSLLSLSVARAEPRIWTPSAGTVAASEPKPIVHYFALGDSIASGHGLGDNLTTCHRSALSYPFIVENTLQVHFDVRFPQSTNFLACSGANTVAVNVADP